MNPYLPAQPVDPGDWRASATCRQVDPELMFPDSARSQTWADALAVCDRCPVRRACLEDALTEEGDVGLKGRHGVRGGLTPRRRRDEAKRRIRTAQTVA